MFEFVWGSGFGSSFVNSVPGCGTAFSFATGRVVLGHIHNPHYYEFLRRDGGEVPREPGDVPEPVACEGMPSLVALLRTINRAKTQTPDQVSMRQTLQSVHMFAMHVQDIELGHYATYDRDVVTANRDLRVLFMRNRLEADEFKKKIIVREKRRLFNDDVHAILSMVVAVVGDAFRALLNAFTFEAATAMMRSMNKLRDYANANLRQTAARYNYTVPIITGAWVVDKENP